MYKLLIVISIILIILGLLGILFSYFYNQAVKFRLRINNADMEIDESLRKKIDLVNKCINIITKKANINSKEFDLIRNVKNNKFSNFEIDRLLTNATCEIIKINDDFTNISTDVNFKSMLREIKTLDENLVALRTYYNKYVNEYNNVISSLPLCILSKLLKFKERKFYDGKDLNDDILKDFKL